MHPAGRPRSCGSRAHGEVQPLYRNLLRSNKKLYPAGKGVQRPRHRAEADDPPAEPPLLVTLPRMATALLPSRDADVYLVPVDGAAGAALALVAGSASLSAFSLDTCLLRFSTLDPMPHASLLHALGLELTHDARMCAFSWLCERYPGPAPALLEMAVTELSLVRDAAPFALDASAVARRVVSVDGSPLPPGSPEAFAAQLTVGTLAALDDLIAVVAVRSALSSCSTTENTDEGAFSFCFPLADLAGVGDIPRTPRSPPRFAALARLGASWSSTRHSRSPAPSRRPAWRSRSATPPPTAPQLLPAQQALGRRRARLLPRSLTQHRPVAVRRRLSRRPPPPVRRRATGLSRCTRAARRTFSRRASCRRVCRRRPSATGCSLRVRATASHLRQARETGRRPCRNRTGARPPRHAIRQARSGRRGWRGPGCGARRRPRRQPRRRPTRLCARFLATSP